MLGLLSVHGCLEVGSAWQVRHQMTRDPARHPCQLAKLLPYRLCLLPVVRNSRFQFSRTRISHQLPCLFAAADKHYRNAATVTAQHELTAVSIEPAATIMSDPVALASSLPLPVPAGDDGLSRVASRKWSLNRRPSSPRDDSQSKDNVVPYQALPVQGPIITLNYTPAMEVLEPDHQRMQEHEARTTQVLLEYKAKLLERTKHHMGYPYNLDFEYGALEGLEKFSINNLGDPFIESNYGVHSREFEIGVLQWFAKLWEIDAEDYWGYITNCGTEGNLHGILVGRENHPDGVLYASKETHYSVFKAGKMYRMPTEAVNTLATGEIDYEHFRARLQANKDKPAIVNVNIGTTVKGAVDDLDRVLEILDEEGFDEDRFYIHCDGALFGLMIPFVRQAPMVTFRKPIGSVSVSGHKFVGAPVPCGVVITRKQYVEALSSDVEYLNSRDATIMGSRNGHAPLYLWYTLTKKGYEGMRKDVEKCLRNAHLLKAMLERVGIKTMLNELSSTVVFERPLEEAFVKKWQLACQGDIAHVVVMPNITLQKLETFVQDLIQSRARVSVAAMKQIAADARASNPDADA